jgi:hypothetical protein
MKITNLRDHLSQIISRSNTSEIARRLERYDIPKIQNSYVASSRSSSSNVYYIIWRKGSGFFSILSSVLCHLQIAENLGFSPVVDFKNFTSTYSENEQINGSHNMWDYYFEPIQSVPLNKVYESGNFVLTDGGHPAGAVMSVSHDESLRDTFRKYVVLNSTTLAALASAKQKVEIDDFTLGIHFRGQEMRRAPGHPFPPTLSQVFAQVDQMFENQLFKNIFLVTEGAEYEKAFKKKYGSLIQTLPHFRRYRKNAYSISPRINHRYLLGQEILVDTLLLAECNSLISGSSNVSEMAILLNANKYDTNCQIRNGTNSQSILLAPFLWQIKSRIPKRFGGFDKNHSSGVIR